MPASNADQSQNRGGIDIRPVGAVAGASLPAKSLLDYLRHDYPAYRRLLEAAEDATDINGNADLKKILATIQPGDFGLSGLQGGGNPLVHGSHIGSGGIGAHGQIAGPYVKTD